MSHLELDLESCAIHCCFDPSLRAGNIAVLLSNGTVEIWTDADSKRLDAKHVGTLRYVVGSLHYFSFTPSFQPSTH